MRLRCRASAVIQFELQRHLQIQSHRYFVFVVAAGAVVVRTKLQTAPRVNLAPTTSTQRRHGHIDRVYRGGRSFETTHRALAQATTVWTPSHGACVDRGGRGCRGRGLGADIRLDMDTVQDSLTSDWAATLNERVADAYLYGVKVAAGDMVRVCHDIAGAKLPSHVLSKELKRAGWTKKQFRRNGKPSRAYTNNVQHSDWADDFANKVGETDALF